MNIRINGVNPYNEDGTLIDFYRILEVSPTDSAEVIKKKYRQLALKVHPDKPTRDPEKFKEITEAYEIISDPAHLVSYNKLKQQAVIQQIPLPTDSTPTNHSQSFPPRKTKKRKQKDDSYTRFPSSHHTKFNANAPEFKTPPRETGHTTSSSFFQSSASSFPGTHYYSYKSAGSFNGANSWYQSGGSTFSSSSSKSTFNYATMQEFPQYSDLNRIMKQFRMLQTKEFLLDLDAEERRAALLTTLSDKILDRRTRIFKEITRAKDDLNLQKNIWEILQYPIRIRGSKCNTFNELVYKLHQHSWKIFTPLATEKNSVSPLWCAIVNGSPKLLSIFSNYNITLDEYGYRRTIKAEFFEADGSRKATIDPELIKIYKLVPADVDILTDLFRMKQAPQENLHRESASSYRWSTADFIPKATADLPQTASRPKTAATSAESVPFSEFDPLNDDLFFGDTEYLFSGYDPLIDPTIAPLEDEPFIYQNQVNETNTFDTAQNRFSFFSATGFSDSTAESEEALQSPKFDI